MSEVPSSKRQRLDGGSFAARPAAVETSLERIDELRARFLSLSPNTVEAIVAVMATTEPYGPFARLIDQEHARAQKQAWVRAAQPISFAKYAGKADYVFNRKYEHLGGSRQSDASGDALATVEAMLDDIVKGTKDYSVYATKKSAVETMRSIFDIMLNSQGVIGHEVRDDCDAWDSKFLQVMGTFTEEELERLVTEDQGAWVEQFRALVTNAHGYCVLERLQESLDDLEAYQMGNKDEDEHKDEEVEDGGHKEDEEDEEDEEDVDEEVGV